MGRGPSPVRVWTLIGALTGLACGFWLAIGTALVNGLVVGAKLPVSVIPYCVIGFECTILFGTLFNFTGTLIHTRLGRREPAVVLRPPLQPGSLRPLRGVPGGTD